jgi:hypothetical protein
MADVYRRVSPGDPVAISATAWNGLLDLLPHRGEGAPSACPAVPGRPAGVVLVKNTTGADRGLFEIVGLTTPLYDPADNLDEFRFRFAFTGYAPDADYPDIFAILQEPVKDAEIGRALVLGVTPVKVDLSDAGHGYAKIEDGTYAHLVSATSGPAQILWKEAGTGEKWALVRLPAGGALPPGDTDYQVLSWDNTDKAWYPGPVRAM